MIMYSAIVYRLTLLIIISLQTTISQFIEKQLCHSKCLCLPDDNVVSCDRSNNMIAIPTNIEKSFHRLIIQNGNFMDPFIYRRNLTGLGHITFLKVIYCRLTGVEPRAFEDMKRLKYLDLSHNNITIIQPFTFIGLNLVELHLMENHGLQLHHDSLKGMYVDSINLRSNNLSSLDFECFDGIRLQKLFLYNNQITAVDPKFATLFSDPEIMIDLTGNPLKCTCNIKWLQDFLKAKSKLPKFFDLMKTVNVTCAAPLSLANIDITSIPDQKLICQPPIIKVISVSLGATITTLTCTALGNGNRLPGVSWHYTDADNVKQLRKDPSTTKSNSPGKLVTTLSINVSLTPASYKDFTCSTWLEDNIRESIIVNIKSPVQTSYPNITSSLSNDILPFLDSNIFHQKQFTVLEMVGAIVGTFIITVILFLMLVQILCWWRRSENRQMMYTADNIFMPYWTMEPNNHHAYSQPICPAEYDLPRLYESRRSSICQSPALNRVGSLDYNTFNDIYSTDTTYFSS